MKMLSLHFFAASHYYFHAMPLFCHAYFSRCFASFMPIFEIRHYFPLLLILLMLLASLRDAAFSSSLLPSGHYAMPLIDAAAAIQLIATPPYFRD